MSGFHILVHRGRMTRLVRRNACNADASTVQKNVLERTVHTQLLQCSIQTQQDCWQEQRQVDFYSSGVCHPSSLEAVVQEEQCKSSP